MRDGWYFLEWYFTFVYMYFKVYEGSTTKVRRPKSNPATRVFSTALKSTKSTVQVEVLFNFS